MGKQIWIFALVSLVINWGDGPGWYRYTTIVLLVFGWLTAEIARTAVQVFISESGVDEEDSLAMDMALDEAMRRGIAKSWVLINLGISLLLLLSGILGFII